MSELGGSFLESENSAGDPPAGGHLLNKFTKSRSAAGLNQSVARVHVVERPSHLIPTT